jgi:hypothetical protein
VEWDNMSRKNSLERRNQLVLSMGQGRVLPVCLEVEVFDSKQNIVRCLENHGRLRVNEDRTHSADHDRCIYLCAQSRRQRHVLFGRYELASDFLGHGTDEGINTIVQYVSLAFRIYTYMCALLLPSFARLCSRSRYWTLRCTSLEAFQITLVRSVSCSLASVFCVIEKEVTILHARIHAWSRSVHSWDDSDSINM